MIKHFNKRGYSHTKLVSIQKQVADIPREDLLKDKDRTPKDPQTIFVADWHSSFAELPTILKKHYHIIQNDPYLKEIFPQKPSVAYRKVKTIRNMITKNDINSPTVTKPKTTVPCGNCKFCKHIQTSDHIKNVQKNITVKLKGGRDCKTSGVIYAASCNKHDVIYVGHTGDKLCDRFSKHRYDIKYRPPNSELATHFNEDHSDEDMVVMILESGIESKPERIRMEDKWICKLQTLQPSGMNADISSFGKEMYALNTKTFS